MPRSIPENMTLDAKMRVLDYTTSDIDVYSQNWTNVTKAYNETLKVEIPILPSEMKFGEQNIIAITVYVLLFLIAASGNLTVFITLCRSKVPKPRINLYILHLSAADLIVTFIMMPLEIAWSLTVDWRAGDAACRILMFFRAFGLYLSSFVLVVISIDRCFAILQPMSLNDADKRGKIMLLIAWLFSLAASAPQVSCVVFVNP